MRVVGVLAFEPQEAQHGMQRRQPELPVAQAGRGQPVLVELEAGGRNVGNPLVETGDQETTDAGINHDE